MMGRLHLKRKIRRFILLTMNSIQGFLHKLVRNAKKRGVVSHKSIAILTIGLFIGVGLVYFFLLRGDGASANWYHDSWGFRRKITIDNTKVSGSSDLHNFAVLVSFSSDSNIAANAKTDGSDILFTDSKGQQLTHEIEYYSAGTLAAWVRIPTLSTSVDTVIYMYYGNSSASGLENETAVWSSDYRGVWHLSETSGQHLDSTSNNNDSTSVSVTTQGSATGKVGGASDFATGNEVVVADSNSLDITGSFTAQAWVKADTIGGSGTWNSIIYKGGNSNYFLELTDTDEIDAGFYGGGDWRGVTTTNSPVSTGSFYHVAVVHDAASDTVKTYVNGVEKGSVSSITQTPLVNTSTFTIGENFYNESFDGIIDEVRLSDSPKSVDWLLTEYNNQNSPSTFYSASHQEVRTRGPAAYWKLDEGHGSSVNDSSGNSITGTMGTGSSAPIWRSDDMCISGKCLEFDGNDDVISTSDIAAAEGQKFTISFWTKPTKTVINSRFLLVKANITGGSWVINTATGGDPNRLGFAICTVSNCSSSGGAYTQNSVLSVNEWVHLALVYDGSQASYTNRIIIYANGVPQTLSYSGTTPASMLESDVGVTIGNINGASSFGYSGVFDEVKIYPYVRTADEIKQDYLFASAKGASAVLGTRDASFMSDGLVGYWKLDESASGECSEFIDGVTYIDDACDSSGNQQSGVWGGDAAATTGKFGNAVNFDGTGDNVDLGDLSATEGASQLTWSFWVKPTALSTTDILFSKANTVNNYSWSIATTFDDANDVSCSIPTTTVDPYTYGYTTGDVLSNGAWAHVICVFDGTKEGNANRLKIYIDGEKQSLSYSGTIPTTTQATGSNARLASTSDNQLFFNGVIDEVRIYKKALAELEVKSLYEWAPGPISYWNFDESTGTVAHDQGEKENNGTLTNSPRWVPGQYGQAINTNSASAYVNIGDPADGSLDFDADDDFTLSAWIKTSDQSSTSRVFMYKGFGGSDPGYRMRLATDGDPACGIADSAAETTEITFNNNPINDGKWHNVTCVISGNGTLLTIYVDGRFGGVTSDAEGSLVSAKSLTIGNNHATGFWPGDIDDVKIYRYARTQEQILEDINAGHPAVGTPVGSTVLHTKFNEGYGSTVHDSSSLSNDGTLGTGSSAPSWSNDGKFGKALSFDGNDYVDFGDNDDLKLTFPFTISAWVNINELPSDEYTIISKWYSFTNDREYAFQIIDDNRLRFGFSSTGSDSEFVYADTAFSSADFDQWIHVVLTADADGNYAFYRNGRPDGSGTFTLTSIANDAASAMIGAVHYSNSLPSRFFKGKIDEVKLYPFDLNSEQVKTEYNGGKTMVLGAKSTGVGGTTPSNSAGREYCVPGDASTCNAPVAEWKMDTKVSGDGQTIPDTSGNSNSGTTEAGTNGLGVDCMLTGKYGSSCKIDNVDDYIEIADSSSLSFGNDTSDNPFSISLWTKLEDATSSTLMSKLSKSSLTTDNEFLLYTTAADIVSFILYDGTTANRLNINGPALTSYENQWMQITVTYDGSLSTDGMSMYINGIKIDTTPGSAGTYNGMPNTSSPILLGASFPDNVVWKGFANASIDHVRIYNYVRTPSQVAWDYNLGYSVAQYKFDECQGSTAYNSALNSNGKAMGNNGTITIGASGTSSIGNCSTASTAWGNGADGKTNASLDFDGSDDYISIADSDEVSFGNGSTDKPFTLTAWINMDDASYFQIVNKGPASGVLTNLEWALSTGINDQLGFRIYDNSALVYIGRYSETALTSYENQWVHVAVTYDGTETANGMSIYINGNTVASIADSNGSYGGLESTNSNIYIGALLPSDATFKSFANGQIDDVRIYNYELNAVQIKTIMSNGAVRFE